MRNILVTGGCGFIGSNFIHHMLESDIECNIINLDALTYAGNMENLEDVPHSSRYVFVKGNICDRARVNVVLLEHDVHAIVNFAAESHVDRSIKDSSEFVNTNVVGVRVLLDAAIKHKIRKFVQIGTDEVYGSLTEQSARSVETDMLAPRSAYAASKAAADLLALSYYHTHGLDVSVTRSSNNYGPYQYPEKIIPLFIIKILREERVPVYGTGKNMRDWLHVMDNCRAIELVLNEGEPGKVYNVGGDNEIRNIDLTECLFTLLGKGDHWSDAVVFVADRKGHDWRYAVNSNRIHNELGWYPQKPFADGLRDTVEWYKENRSWWEKTI